MQKQLEFIIFFNGIAFVLISKKRKEEMTLVPIIYTSLFIFFAFLLFVLIVSYISYKAKSRGKLPRSAEPIPNRRLALAGNTLPINNRVGKPIVKQIQSSRPITINNNFSTKKHFTQDVGTRRTEKHKLNPREDFMRLNQHEKNYNTNKSLTVNPRNKTTQFIEGRRFEIMNQNENFRTIEERKSYKEDLPKQGPNLAEMNLLNYYSDNNEFEMVTLSASRINRAI